MNNTKYTEQFDKPGKAMNKIAQLLRDSDKPTIDIYRDCGLPYFWLNRLIKGHAVNPSINRMEHLYKYLTGKDLL